MKVLVNGGLNLSQFDGWWAEAWNDQVGWAIRPGASFEELSMDGSHDDADAEELYELLEQQVIPEFYRLDDKGLPASWLKRIRASMNQLTARYSAGRMVREYTSDFYLPMVAGGQERTAELARDLVEDRKTIANHWPRLRFGELTCQANDNGQAFTLCVYLGGLSQDQVALELVAEECGYGPRIVQAMTMSHQLEGSEDSYLYSRSEEHTSELQSRPH